MSTKKYSEKKRNEVLMFLRENDHSYYRTAKKFKISSNTIKSWDDYPSNVPKEAMDRINRNKNKQKKVRQSSSKVQILELEKREKELPDDIRELFNMTFRKSLKRIIILLEDNTDLKDHNHTIKSLIALSNLPKGFMPDPSSKSLYDEIMEKYHAGEIEKMDSDDDLDIPN